MEYAYRVYKNVQYFYNTINPATLSGAIDVIVVEQPDGELKSTPFHVRFGKYGVFNHYDKYVDIAINNDEIADLKMKLGPSGVAYFVEEAEKDETVPDYMITSPLPDPEQMPVHEVLTESAKKLTEAQQKRDEKEKEKRSGSLSSEEKTPTAEVRPPRKEEQSLSEVQQQRYNKLPFTSSVFSNRRNRSLPDLTELNDRNDGYHSDCENNRKITPPRKLSCRATMQGASSQGKNQSVLAELRTRRLRKISDMSADENAPEPKTKPTRKSSRMAARPINITIENDSESDLDSSVSSNLSSPSHSVLDARDAERIADGALSDSELDRHRMTPEPHANDVRDWKWGELPETAENKTAKDKKEQSEPKTQQTSWSITNWFKPRTPTLPPIKSAETEGITLDDLLSNAKSDPVKIEKYLGKAGPGSTNSVSIDSGNVSRGVSQPSSPSMKSEEDSTFVDKTPTESVVTIVAGPSSSGEAVDQRSVSSADDVFALSEDEFDPNDGPTYVRSLRLSSEKLKALRLERGANEARFSITTKFQGTSWCSCNIYLYKWDEKIIISDIDGTITKSDVLGHVIPAIGGQWAHTGVADLYTRIKNNGYKMIYLSSRAIGQSHTTKQYLKSVAQDSRQLPDGPVLLSPTSVLVAFRREVIERRPEEFKIAALSDVKKLFPTSQPFYAGFGNRETDVMSYRAVEIQPARILIIDPSGRVRRSDSVGYVSNYLSMANETVDYLFPPLMMKPGSKYDGGSYAIDSSWTRPLEHSDFMHWRGSSVGVDGEINDDELATYESKRKVAATNRLASK